MIEDRRVRRTKSALQAALFESLQEKSLDKVTVAELVDKAQISRKAFYDHYLDKYDLAEQVEADMAHGFGHYLAALNPDNLPQGTSAEEAVPYLTPMLDFIEDHLPFFELVAEKKLGLTWYEDVMETYLDGLHNPLYDAANPWAGYQKDMAKAIAASNWNRWVKTGRKESKEDLASWIATIDENAFFTRDRIQK